MRLRTVLSLTWGLALWAAACNRGDKSEGAAGAPGSGRSVAVSAALVTQQDVPVYLQGLGNVTAFYTVTVRSQVDGRVDRVLFREGEDVRQGQLLALVDVRPFEIQLHQAQAALKRDAATFKNHQVNLDRDKALRERNLIPQQQVDDQRALVDQFEGTVMSDQTQVDNANLQLAYAHITAPISGRTGVRLVDPGNLVHANDADGLVVITQLDPIAVLFTMPEDDLPSVAREMQKNKLVAEATSRNGQDALGSGEVQLIDNQINATTGTMRLKAVFANPNHTLWPNQFVKIRVRLTTLKGAVVVPAATIQRGPQGTFAYVVQQDQTVEMRPVEVNTLQGDSAVIGKGLKVGEQVVTDGQYQLRPGSKVVVRTAESSEKS